jgi:hypothetical protein
MSAPKYQYELWISGAIVAKYQTIGQALLGALWRSRKREKTVYIWSANKPYRLLAEVRGGGDLSD